MSKRFYLSTRSDRSQEGAAIAHALQEHGWQCTFDWTALGHVERPAFPEVAAAEIEAIRQADLVVVLLPGGFGTHVEIGAALALGKPTVLHAPNLDVLETPYPCVFHYHECAQLIVSESLEISQILGHVPS